MTQASVSAARTAPAIERIRRERAVAILRGVPDGVVEPLADALVAGGVSVLEITLDHPDASDAIGRLARRDDVVVGAGTARTESDVDDAARAGAAFVVSPATIPVVVDRCHAHGLPAVPGALTPTEVETAWRLGAALVKLFPAGALGPGYVRDLLAPLGGIPLLVTGGVSAANATAFFAAGAVAVGVGTSLFPPAALAAGDWSAITASARALVR